MQETYNFTVREMVIGDWESVPEDYVNYAVTGGDSMNYIFTLRDADAVKVAVHDGLMYDLSTLDCLDFSEEKYSKNLAHKKYSLLL